MPQTVAPGQKTFFWNFCSCKIILDGTKCFLSDDVQNSQRLGSQPGTIKNPIPSAGQGYPVIRLGRTCSLPRHSLVFKSRPTPILQRRPRVAAVIPLVFRVLLSAFYFSSEFGSTRISKNWWILPKNQSPDPLQVLESEPRIFQNLIINSIDETVQSFALAIPIALSVSNKWRGSLSKSSSDMLHMLHMHLGLVNTIGNAAQTGYLGSPDTERNSIMCD